MSESKYSERKKLGKYLPYCMIPFLQNTRKYNASYQKKAADKSMMTWGLGVYGGWNTFESDGYVHSFDHEL